MRNEGLEHPDITYCREFGYPPNKRYQTDYEEDSCFTPRSQPKRRSMKLKMQSIINDLNARTEIMMTANLVAAPREEIEAPVEQNDAQQKKEA